jgi:hypothetical protein
MTDDSPRTAPAKPSESSRPAATAPVGAEPAAATPASANGARSGTRLGNAWQGTRRFAMALFGYPSGRWPAPTVTSLLVAAVLVVGAIELLPKAMSDVTLSVRARSEVLEIELDRDRTYVWWLPAGRYSLVAAKAVSGCEQRSRFDVACTYASPTAITIKNGATVRFEVLGSGADGLRFSAALTPRELPVGGGATDEASIFTMHDASDELLVETGDLLTFESGPVDVWRIPLIVTRVQIGEFLSESLATADTLGAGRQPIMTEGDVRIFARTPGSRDRYQVQEERFDPADVVQIPAYGASDSGLLLGLLSLDRATAQAFDVTMHTALAEVFVRRLGAEHQIGVSTWSIVAGLPTWTALWVVLVSLIVVANYHAARLQQLQGENS